MKAPEIPQPLTAPELEALIRAAALRYGMRLDVTDLAAVSRACQHPSAATAALARTASERPFRPPAPRIP